MAMGGTVGEMHAIITEAPGSAFAPETAIATLMVLGPSYSMFAVIVSRSSICSVLSSRACEGSNVDEVRSPRSLAAWPPPQQGLGPVGPYKYRQINRCKPPVATPLIPASSTW